MKLTYDGFFLFVCFSGMKAWAYREDQLITTHPIEGEVSDTDQTFLNFDGITYGKGASLLKQLVHLVGMDGFKAGMRYYFGKYQWGNTTISVRQELKSLNFEFILIGLCSNSWRRLNMALTK